MSAYYDLITSGAGAINKVIDDLPSNYTNWASFVAIFDQCRVLSLRVDFVPTFYNTVTSTTLTDVATVVDRNDNTALTGYSDAMEYSSCMMFAGNVPFFRFLKMEGVEESDWKSTSSPVAEHFIKFYSSGNSFTTSLGSLQQRILIQFRSRH